ncbi:MAG: efflux RND transporter permease subunit [Bdellovibrionales bacterium]|nr:efflux RND transporter permease subunit [Bdellovibrionales bacterium]
MNLAILVVGYFSLDDIANEFIPAVEIPAVGVVFPTTFLHHDKVEQLLIEKVERQLLATGDVEKIETTLDKDRTILFIFYKWSLTPEESLQRARQTVSAIPRPQGVLEPIFVLHRPSMSPIYRVAFSGQSSAELTRQLEPFLGQVERLPGVAETRLVGASPQYGVIEVDPLRSAQLGITTTDILSSAKKEWSFRTFLNNSEDERRTLLRIKLDGLAELADLPVRREGKKGVPLKWISTLKNESAPATVFVGDRKESVVLEVLKAPGSDAIAIVDRVQQLIGKIREQTNLESLEIYNEAEKIKEAQKGVLVNFALGVTLNSIVLIIFLGSLIGAVVASCVFPTAILGTLFVMKFSGVSLNIFALNGFSLASGMITDASIVVLEAIMRRFQRGESLFSSSFRGTKDVFWGVLASTLTTAAVIVPISIQSGVSSKLFSDLGIVLVTTQFISLIAVFTFVPWICSKILSNDEKRPKVVETLFRGSGRLVDTMNRLSEAVLDKTNRSQKLRWALPVGVTILSVIMLMALPDSEFLPSVSSRVYSVSIPVPRIQLREQGVQLVKKVSRELGQDSSIDWVISSHSEDSVKATFSSNSPEIKESVEKKLSDLLSVSSSRVVILPVGPAPSSEPLSYDGYYYISKELPLEKRMQLIEEFCQSPGVIDCISEQQYVEPVQLLTPDILAMVRAQTNNLSTAVNVASLTRELDVASLGGLEIAFPVNLRAMGGLGISEYPMAMGKERATVRSLGSLYEKKFTEGQSVRFRKNGNSFVPIYFRISGMTIGQAAAKMTEVSEKYGSASQTSIPMGTIENMEETFQKMIGALILSAVLILLVLVVQFRSVGQALIIMYSMPLSVGGAVAGLLITGETLNVGVIVGFILLIGIIVNNGILLMDAINQRLASGMSILESVSEAVESRTRPILMTTFSTIFGMLPTLVLEAEGKELYQGMAIVNIFGMGFGTFLTLVIIPVVIRSLLNIENKKNVGSA